MAGTQGTYILLVSHKTLDEIDKGFAEGKKFEAAMGEEGMKKFGELSASCLESSPAAIVRGESTHELCEG